MTTKVETKVEPVFYKTQHATHQRLLRDRIAAVHFAVLSETDLVAQTKFEACQSGRMAWLAVLPERSLDTHERNVVQSLDGDPVCSNGDDCRGSQLAKTIAGRPQQSDPMRFVPMMPSKILRQWRTHIQSADKGGGAAETKNETEPCNVWPSGPCVLCLDIKAFELAVLINHYSKNNRVEAPKSACFQLFRPVGFGASSLLTPPTDADRWKGFDRVPVVNAKRMRFFRDGTTGQRWCVSLQGYRHMDDALSKKKHGGGVTVEERVLEVLYDS